MIAIKKSPAHAFMTDPDGKWVKETAEAKIFYRTSGRQGDFQFQHYRDPLVKEALKKDFIKCAYCDSAYAAVYDGDVEHFRPKGRVKEKQPQKPGYYWLANDWNNLLLSCQHCNQARGYPPDEKTNRMTLGKLDQFPLSDPAKRAMCPEDPLEREEEARLLINPCVEDPEPHFSYDEKNAAMVALTEKARHSMLVYALTRPELAEAREARMMQLFFQLDNVNRELLRYNEAASPEQKTIFLRQLYLLRTFTCNASPYAGMARYFVNQFLVNNNLK